MVYILLADGFEELEAVAPADILRRANIPVSFVRVGETAIGAHTITIASDCALEDVSVNDAQMIYLPGGMPGAENLYQNPKVQELVKACVAAGKWVCALCAAPLVMGRLGLLDGVHATCYPGFEDELKGALTAGERIVKDKNFITGIGPGAAAELGFEMVSVLKSPELAKQLKAAMQYA